MVLWKLYFFILLWLKQVSTKYFTEIINWIVKFVDKL